jgi:hypothetical protein
MSPPYRTSATVEDPAPTDTETEAFPDTDVLPFLGVFWLASVGRVAAGIARHETMGAETTLAWLAVVFLPLLFKEPAAWVWRRCRRGRSQDARKTAHPQGG